MPHPGRNDPCPCGSGRKFKRCCADGAAPPADVTDIDRAQAYGLLERLAQSRRFSDDFTRVAPLLHDDSGKRPGPLDDVDDEIGCGRIIDWFVFDVPLDRGGTIALEALRAHGEELSRGARRFVAELCEAPLRLLQVRTVCFKSDAVCADLLEPGKTYRVNAPWLALQRHQLLVARIVERGSFWEIEGDPAVLPPHGKRRFVRHLHRLRDAAERSGATAALVRMVRGAALLRLMTLADALLDEELYTTEGDPVQPTSAFFVIQDRGALEAALAGAADIVKEWDGMPVGAGFAVIGEEGEKRFPLGFAAFDGPTLRVDACSPARAARVQVRLTELAGGALTFDRIETERGADIIRAAAGRVR